MPPVRRHGWRQTASSSGSPRSRAWAKSSSCRPPSSPLHRTVGGRPGRHAAEPAGSFQVTPSGSRPYYCFESVSHVAERPAQHAGRPRSVRHRARPGAAGLPRFRSGRLCPLWLGSSDPARHRYPRLQRRDSVDDRAGPPRRLPRMDGNPDRSGARPACRSAAPSGAPPSSSTTTRAHPRPPSGPGRSRPTAQSTTIDLHNGWKVEVLTVPVGRRGARRSGRIGHPARAASPSSCCWPRWSSCWAPAGPGRWPWSTSGPTSCATWPSTMRSPDSPIGR